MKYLVSFIFVLVFCSVGKAQFTIANGLPGCLPVTDQEGMVCGGGTTFFGINGLNQFQVQNVDGINCCAGPGGDSGSYFEFDVLNINDFMNINISMAYSASNTNFEDDSPSAPIFGCSGTIVDNSHDQILFTYSINGGSEIQSLYVHGTTQAAFTGTWNAGPLNGNTLKIRVYASNKATAEIFYFQNLLITGTPKISAGPDDVVCYPGVADLNGVWTGTWSGGSGMIGNVNQPVTTYTPSAAEQNSMVTLTYTGIPAYVGCPTPSDQMVVTVNPTQDATFDFSDFCVGSPNGPTNIVTPGGTFSFNPVPGGGTTINPTTGVISNAVGGTTYTVQYVSPGSCPGTELVMVQALTNQNANFTFADFCIGQPNGPTGIVTPGGTFSFNPNPGDGATINSSTGIISNPVGGSSYGVQYITPGPCPNNLTLSVDVIDLITPMLDPLGPYCTSDGNVQLPTVQDGVTGNWSGPGIMGNQFNPSSTGAGMFQITFTPNAGQCATVANTNVNVIESPTGNLSGTPVLCPGQCGVVMFSFNGGSGTYDLNLNISAGFFNFNFPMVGVTNNTVLTICLDNGAPFDPSTNTLNIPTFVPDGTYTLTLLNFASVPSSPCSTGTVNNPGFISVTINDAPVANSASLTLCDFDQDGSEIFDLTTLESTVTGGAILNTVTWYSDVALNNQINNPTTFSATSGTIVYAVVTTPDGCENDNQVLLTVTSPTVPNASNFNICINDPLLNLPLTVSGVSGNWTGANVSNNQFNPTGLPAGNYAITFTPSGNQCAVTTTVDVIISNAGPIFLPNPIITSCIGLGSASLGNVQGGVNGVWSGSPFLTGDVFDFVSSGVGSFTVTFTPVGAMTCFSPNTTQVVVVANTTLAPVSFPDLCQVSGIYDLGSTIQGEVGVWSGNPQVFNNLFDPNITPGIYPLVFTPNDPCVNPLSTSINVIPFITLTPPVLGPTCTNGSPIVLPTTINSIPGTWSLGGVPLTIFDPSLTGTGVFTLDFTVDAGFCAMSFSTTISVSAISAGIDSLEVVCRTGSNITVNLNTYLSSIASPGGSWEFNGLPVSDPLNVDISTLPNGLNEFFYLINDPNCGRDTSVVTFNLAPENNAGNSTTQSLCITNISSVNFASYLGPITNGGTWVQPSGVNVDLSNLTDVNLSALSQGSYDFAYILADNGCAPDTSHTIINIQPFNNAGNNITTTLCLGSTVDLTTLVDGGYTDGNFLNPNAIPGLTDSLWNTTGLSAYTYVFLYEAVNLTPCLSDTATLTLNLATELSAGNSQISNYCEGSTINLNNYLSSGASFSGLFYFNGNVVPNDTFNTSGSNLLTFQYIVGDGVSCPRDTSFITLSRVPKPVLTIDPIVNICDGDCQSILVNHNADIGSNFSFSLTSSGGQTYRNQVAVTNNNPLDISFCASSTGPFNFNNLPLNQTFSLRIDSLNTINGGCRFNYIVTSNFNTLSTPKRNIVRTLCSGNTFAVGSDIYSEANPSGITTIPSVIANQCDTIINVNLTFVGASPVTNIVQNTCDQAFSITVGNVVFNSANPIGQIILQNVNGCDSVVDVNITYSSFSSGNFNFSTCDPEYQFTLGGQTFDRGNPNGSVTLMGASASGCDSIVNVALAFLPNSSFNFSLSTCDDNYSVNIGNQTFNKATPIGSITLPNQAQNGCDSVVSVNITFIPMAIGRNDIATCNDDFSLTVNNTTFNKANPSGSYILPGAAANGCDSLVNVQLNFTDFNFIYALSFECDASNANFNINLASHPGPYQFTINNVVQATQASLPFNTSFIPGSYFIEVETFDGCQDTLTVAVDENSGPIVTLSQSPLSDGTTQLTVNAPTNILYDLIWTPSSTLTCFDCYDPIANPTETTTYTLQYMYGDDCVDSRIITVEKLNSEVIVPNIFSPNGDGSNDQFYIKLPDGVTGLIRVMRVYDRWGNLIFDKKDIPANEPAQGWQGDMNGNFVVSGVYIYYLEIQIDGKPGVDKYSGDVTLTR